MIIGKNIKIIIHKACNETVINIIEDNISVLEGNTLKIEASITHADVLAIEELFYLKHNLIMSSINGFFIYQRL